MKKITLLFAALFIVFAASAKTLYLTPNSNWKTDNARFAAYFFGNGEKWVSMTKVAGETDLYSVEAPSGFSKVIFCRMNPGASANNWNNKWNQTGDLTVPGDAKNHYKVPAGSWDGSTATWVTYTPPTTGEPIVRFSNMPATAKKGTIIKPTATVENMENPTYAFTVSYEGGATVAVDATAGYVLENYGSYVFTVVATGNNNATATTTATVSVDADAYVAGTSALCNGKEWSANAPVNAMEIVDGVYTIVLANVPAGSHEFKVVYKGEWLGGDKLDVENSTKGCTKDGNIGFTLAAPTTITISYNATTQKIILKADGISQFGEFVITSYTLCGSAAIFGQDFNTTLTANDMVGKDGVWTKTYENIELAAGEYRYKVAANYAWNQGQYPSNGDNILNIEVAGKYNLTFTYEPDKTTGEKLVCVVEKVDVEETIYTIYFDNTNSAWEKVYAYCWNGEGDAAVANAAWPGVELTNPENNVYTYTTTTTYEKVIFNAGEGKPQTMDLVFENGKTYSIDIAYVLGTVNYEKIENDECWTPGVAEYKMTYDATTGIWAKTYTNLPAGDYQFKLYCGDWLNEVVVDSVSSTPGFKYDNSGDNISFTLSDVATVTITYNAMLNTFTIVGQGIDKFGELVVTSYTLCGSKEIFGGEKDFDETLTANDMTEKDGVWSKTYEGVQLAAYNEETEEGVQYMYKVAANHAWNGAAYPSADLRVVFWVAEAGKYNITFTFTPDSEEFKLNHIIEKVNEGPVTEVENAAIANIYTQSGMVVAEGEFQIFTITGQNVTDMNGNLANGVYVVRTANATAKVVVK